MSPCSTASRHHRGGGGATTTLLAATKVAVASAALAAAASLAVPRLASLAGAVVFPRVWAAVARFWLAPPYLFVAVHLIILVIWKLSDHKHFGQPAHRKDPTAWPVVVVARTPAAAAAAVQEAVVVKAKEESDDDAYGAGHLQLEPAGYSSPEFSPDSGSCVTTESDEDASSAPSVEARRSVAPVQDERAVPEGDLSSLPSSSSQTVDCEGGGGGDGDDMDATWNAIMQKARSAQQQQPPPRARDPSVGAEEMNRRFDDFIKKKRNSSSFGRRQ